MVLALSSLTTLTLGPNRVDAREPDPSRVDSQASPAPTDTTVLLVPLAAEGLASADQERLTASFHAAFEHADITVLAPAKLDPCSDEPCLRELGRARGASHVVQVEVVAEGRDFVGEFVVVAVASDGPAHIVDAGCQICGIAEFEDRVAARAVAARDLILARPRIGRLELVGVPERARVRIDGRLRGRLPLTAELAVGPHELIVGADAHYPQIIPIEAAAGVAQRIELDLEPKPRLQWHRPTGWALLGSGAASLVTGVALIAAHGSAASLRCRTGGRADDPEFVDAEGDCRWLRRTRGAGIGLTVAGLAASSAGVGLLITDAGRRRAHQRRTELRLSFGVRHIDLQLSF